MRKIGLIVVSIFILSSCNSPSKKESTTNQSTSQADTTSLLPKQDNLATDSVLQDINLQIRKDINNPDLYLERSRIYELMGDDKAAVKDIDRALRIDSTYLNTIIAQSDFMLKRGELNTAMRILGHAKKLYPESSKVYQKMSEMFLVAGNNTLSIRNADLAVKYDKFNGKAYYLKGVNFIQMGDTNRSISSFRTAVEQNPQDFESYMQLGIIFSSLKDSLALAYFRNAMEIKPENKEALYGMGMYEQENEMYNEALATYTKLTKLYPDFKEGHFNLGYVYMYYLHLYSEAKIYFTDAIKAEPKYYEAYYNRGYCFELLGDINNAAKDYRQALAIQPDYTLAAEGLSRLDK